MSIDAKIFVLENRIRKLTEQVLWKEESLKETRAELHKVKKFMNTYSNDRVYVAYLQSELSELERQYDTLQKNFHEVNAECSKYKKLYKEITEHFDVKTPD